MNNIDGKTVVITGGTTGIGFALAMRFGALGANILIGEPREAKLAAAADALRKNGVNVECMAMDVTDTESVERFADYAWRTFGTVDILLNNAGVGLGIKSMTDIPINDVRRLFDVNFFGVWNGASIFGRRMIDAGTPAAIYNVGSENSFFNAAPNMAAYIASKHAVRGLTEAMRDEFPDFIRIGLICPGFVKSEMTPPPFGDLAMNADNFAEQVVEQIRDGQFYVVTHAYNIERINPIHKEISRAYEKYAPRYDGDEEYDVKTLIARARQKTT